MNTKEKDHLICVEEVKAAEEEEGLGLSMEMAIWVGSMKMVAMIEPTVMVEAGAEAGAVIPVADVGGVAVVVITTLSMIQPPKMVATIKRLLQAVDAGGPVTTTLTMVPPHSSKMVGITIIADVEGVVTTTLSMMPSTMVDTIMRLLQSVDVEGVATTTPSMMHHKTVATVLNLMLKAVVDVEGAVLVTTTISMMLLRMVVEDAVVASGDHLVGEEAVVAVATTDPITMDR